MKFSEKYISEEDLIFNAMEYLGEYLEHLSSSDKCIDNDCDSLQRWAHKWLEKAEKYKGRIEEEKQVMDAIKRHGPIDADKIAKVCNINDIKVTLICSRLIKKGIIQEEK